jgi:hypothetical protein
LRCWRARRSGSGKRIEQKVVHVFHVNADGKATDWWNFWEDQAALDDLLRRALVLRGWRVASQ